MCVTRPNCSSRAATAASIWREGRSWIASSIRGCAAANARGSPAGSTRRARAGSRSRTVPPARIAARRSAHAFLEQRDRLPDDDEQLAAARRQVRARVIALEQRRAEVVLEFLHRDRQRRLADAERARRLADPAGVRDRLEVAQLPEVHDYIYSVYGPHNGRDVPPMGPSFRQEGRMVDISIVTINEWFSRSRARWPSGRWVRGVTTTAAPARPTPASWRRGLRTRARSRSVGRRHARRDGQPR